MTCSPSSSSFWIRPWPHLFHFHPFHFIFCWFLQVKELTHDFSECVYFFFLLFLSWVLNRCNVYVHIVCSCVWRWVCYWMVYIVEKVVQCEKDSRETIIPPYKHEGFEQRERRESWWVKKEGKKGQFIVDMGSCFFFLVKSYKPL